MFLFDGDSVGPPNRLGCALTGNDFIISTDSKQIVRLEKTILLTSNDISDARDFIRS